MNPPPSNLPPAFVPPVQQPPRKAPGCWAYGFVTCLVVFIILAVIIAVAIDKASKSPQGKDFFKSFGTAVQSAQKMAPCIQKEKDIYAAIQRYHTHTGTYPPNLQALEPTYLAGADALHCEMDTNSDPKHVTFVYTKPTSSSSPASTMVSFDWKYTLNVGSQNQQIDTVIGIAINGQTTQQQTETLQTVGANGVTTTTKTVVPTTTPGTQPAPATSQ